MGNGLKHDILKTFTKSILAITGQVNMYLSHIDQVYATYLSGVSSVGTLSVILVQGVILFKWHYKMRVYSVVIPLEIDWW